MKTRFDHHIDKGSIHVTHNKTYHIICLLFFAFFLGVVHSFLVYTGFLEKFILGSKMIPFYYYPLFLIGTFYITLTIHELGHLISFKIQGVHIRALYLTMFVFYKKQQKWRFLIRPKLWVLFGGLVVPDIGLIHDDESYIKLRKQFSIALICAPFATIFFAIVTFVFLLLSVFVFQSSILIGFMFVFTVFTLIWSLLYYMTFNLHTQSLYGDFVAYRLIKEDDLFALSQMTQYTMFSSLDDPKTSDFLFEKMISTLNKTPLNYSLFCQMLIINYIHGIIYDNRKINEALHTKLLKYAKTIPIRDEHALSIAYELCSYFYKNLHVEDAYLLFEKIGKTKTKKIDSKIDQYLLKKAEHQLGMIDHSNYLLNHKNIYIGQMWIFEPLIDPYAIEKETHIILPYVEFSCKVDLNQIEENSPS
jgi:hypothetical protein